MSIDSALLEHLPVSVTADGLKWIDCHRVSISFDAHSYDGGSIDYSTLNSQQPESLLIAIDGVYSKEQPNPIIIHNVRYV